MLTGEVDLPVYIHKTTHATKKITLPRDAVCAADTPSVEPALSLRRERFLASIVSVSEQAPRRLLPLPHPDDDSESEHLVFSRWFRLASAQGDLVRPSQKTERCTPSVRRPTMWKSPLPVPVETCHAWTDGSFRRSAGYGFVVTRDDHGASPLITQKSACLGRSQAVFDAELSAIKAALTWYLQGSFKHMVIHSDSTSAGPGQRIARDIQKSVKTLEAMSRSAQIVWVKGHSGVPGNERADAFAGAEA
jgi:ribonuclease HI